jgi:hypothetical protein
MSQVGGVKGKEDSAECARWSKRKVGQHGECAREGKLFLRSPLRRRIFVSSRMS